MTSDYRLAAIAADEKGSIEPLFDIILASLRDEGRTVVGFIQRGACNDPGCPETTVMEDVETGERIPIMQSLGPSSQSCQLDPDKLARVTASVLSRLPALPDIAVVNRFGRAEADGGGMRAVFETALELDVPVLTAVNEDYRSAWTAYVGALSPVLLPASPVAVLAWCRDTLEHSRAR
ncbi:uncharacterized protein DUF2478 [Breoghania corrubedonensis]|uniref:Uncharacterized protein DUF2478 n=1 Tax=Breoghania corrubedonensis TaxID=665038 RepID=A0A2T5VBH7_9HYPH|nr:DUF2478 domain-containing protein [Breoghania corrubedonensis]PTW61097.1 uncharacterized protein DUF2478 [Breoghania corrubedonensis]